MSIRIPEGYVFVPRVPGLAVGLLDAAKRIKADRVMSVRTVTGGYHVLEEVAAAYQGELPAVEEEPQPEATTLVEESIPDETWKVADIEAWAAAQSPSIELPVGKKADKLAAIHQSIATGNQDKE